MERPLNRHDYRTLSLAALGGALEFYDFVIYVFLAPVIGRLFFPVDMPDWLRQLQTFGIFAAGYLARPLGGIVISHFGDRLGRKRMFTLSIFLMAAPTLAIGLLPTYASIGIAAPLLLLVMRILQGVAIGGEVPGAWVFVAEHVPAQRFGLGIGTLTAGLTVGILLGSLMAGAINTIYSTADVARFAWRIPFLVGGAFGFVAVWLRRFLEETPVFKEMSARRALAREVPLTVVLRTHRGATLVALALTLGCLFFGWASDRFGTRAAMVAGFGGLLVSSYAFYSALPNAPAPLTMLYALTGFFVGAATTVPIVAVRSFPAAIRFSGLSFSYNVSYATFGGLTPVVLTLWLRTNEMAPAHYVGGLAILGILLAFAPNSEA